MAVERIGDDVPDQDLAALARLGDKKAFAMLVGRHCETARRLAETVLGDRDLARDASQEAIVVALVSLDRLAKPASFGSWLCGIALNVARRWLQESRRVAGVPSENHPDHGPGPDELAEAAVVAERVREAVAELAPGQRDAVMLFYLQGLSHREVAAELGISPGAVKARLHQARGVLAPRLSALVEKEPRMTDEKAPEPRWVDVTIAGIRRPGGDDAYLKMHIVILKETGGARELPIGVLATNAVYLAVILESVEMPRPMTHQFAAGLLGAAGGRVDEVRITRLVEGSFYAVVVVDGPVGRRDVDARPSDALSLASIVGAPIRVDERILDDPSATGYTAWRDYPTTESDLANEAREAVAGRTAGRAREDDR
ncbi:bifunctional nuclease domain-containing protein [Jiangella asiatica]|uniref:Sigma-70 family RNA polymerase sigma factor n=1 Tax=Jiangella asiatica TaxID=2530372 RepID=A0A4R5CIA7_9ACTN|nr:bifunctional nuclease domain-containing protein [Jiangella asiatica]TDD99921.1 sigma-70 family RNA polymerase sigma factor [Jiangella asiatica]